MRRIAKLFSLKIPKTNKKNERMPLLQTKCPLPREASIVILVEMCHLNWHLIWDVCQHFCGILQLIFFTPLEMLQKKCERSEEILFLRFWLSHNLFLSCDKKLHRAGEIFYSWIIVLDVMVKYTYLRRLK